jgi:pSer/pThr/pTyr-binding forkhead associated (FHA) protein
MNTGEHRDSAAAPLVAESAPSVHLAIQNGTQKGTRIRCRHVVTLIGSREHCKIRLPHDRVAPVHLAIINDGKHVTAVDLLSESGTSLNDLKMEQEELSDGDRLEVGPWDFVVEIANASRNGSHNGEHVNLEPTPQCVALEHVDSGRVLQPNRSACLIGRRNGCDIVLADPDVSRAHALLINYRDYPAVVDLASKIGTKVNGEVVAFRVLKDGDMLAIGDSQFKVRIVGTPVAKPPKPSVKQAAEEAEEVAAALLAEEPEPDLIDIKAVEGAQRWRIADDADKLEKAGKR